MKNTLHCLVVRKPFTTQRCRQHNVVCSDINFYASLDSRKPILSIEFHDTSILFFGRPVDFKCSACLEISGNLSWIIIDKSPVIEHSVPLTDPRVTFSIVRTRKCPNRMESTLRLDVNKNLQMQDIACEAYLILNNNITIQKRSISPSFKIVEGPQKPSLKVYYYEPPSTILVNEELVAYCIACLGVYNTITWRLLNASNEPVIEESLLDSLTLEEKNTKGNLGLGFLYIIVYNQSNCGTKVTSIITLMVNLDLHNKRLACLSFNRTYIEGFDITDLSELFVVSVPNKEKVSDLQVAVKALIWITVALIIFVLAQQITNFTSSTTGEEGDSDRQRMETLKRHRIRSQIKFRKTLATAQGKPQARALKPLMKFRDRLHNIRTQRQLRTGVRSVATQQ
ncbi:hypothetical protein PoB_006497600 [Plakobranchus ocellatus]|uniref:Uncharacterized protein n=1 Tax=Plakobranchus ocellatus TaxID=259542 RepID=A0AAV4D2R6_9GAST|nr:hypothetical protein PoB_006497600 [Plakobranchus ocellatus]